MKKLLSIILSITMLFSMATVAFAYGVDGTMQKAKIKVAMSADFKPFEYYDESGTLAGFDIDLMNYIGETIGFNIEFVNMSFDKLIPAVVNGEVACAISGITITKERESVIDYTTPYLVAQSEVDGEPQYEQYAIVFPDNFVQKAKLAEAAGQEFIYTLVNDAVNELIEDATIEKLIQKYELNKNTKETGYSYYVLDSRYNEFVDTDTAPASPYKSVLFNYDNAETAAKVGDILNFKAENVERFHIGKVNEEQLTVIVDISDPDDIKKFYNRFALLEFTDNSDVEDAITILMRVKINDEIHTGEYYTHYGIFSKANDTNAETIEGKYISEQELYKIIEEMGYEWTVNNAGAGPLPEVGGSPLAPPSDWATADVDKAKALNITGDDVIYRYSMSITREEFCELAYNYIVEFGKDLEVSNNHKFKDTDNEKIEALNSLGIIYGKSVTEFAPNDLLTREEAATILNRLINVVHPDLASTELYFEFADSEQISDWSMSAIQRICNMGIMKGVGNNNFAPQDNYTTEQAIVTLVRVYASSGASKNVIGGANDMVSFYNINSHDNTRGEKIEKQEDGWYKLPSVVGSFINYDGEEPKSVTAYFTPAGTDMEQYEKQVGFTELLWTQNPVSVKLTFAEDDTLGHLHFVFGYENGATTRTAMFNVLIEH